MTVEMGGSEGCEVVADLVKMKASHWDTALQGSNFAYREIPAALVEDGAEARLFMVEAAAEATERLMVKILELEESL